MYSELLTQIDEIREQILTYLPVPPEQERNIQEFLTVELAYTSNAIEGNTLTRQETAQVIEKGFSVEGKRIQELLEARNHAEAWNFCRELRTVPPSEMELLAIHQHILRGIDDAHAGRYRSVPVRISGSEVILPNPLRVPELMSEFMKSLQGALVKHPAVEAIQAHLRLVSIHPFVDGNGRTARMLMNLLLERSGYPVLIILPEERLRYISAIEQAQLNEKTDEYLFIMLTFLVRSSQEYLKLIHPND